jgi:TonB family protein
MSVLLSIALFLATSLQSTETLPTAAKPASDPSDWIKITDYPADALTSRQAGTVAFKLDVDPAGNVSACRIVGSSGSASLDTMTCALLFIRARFTPARDAAGTAVAGNFSSRITWVFPPDYKGSPSALKPVELRRGVRDAAGKSILRIGEDGIIATCVPAGGAYSNVLPLPDICRLFPVGARYGPPATVNGKPVKREVTITLSVYDVNVR